MLSRLRNRLAGQSGFALPTVLILLFAGSLFAAASWEAARGDIGQTGADRNAKVAALVEQYLPERSGWFASR
jgi:hypothetical protein